jgi:hypothetical protein
MDQYYNIARGPGIELAFWSNSYVLIMIISIKCNFYFFMIKTVILNGKFSEIFCFNFCS